MDRQNASPETQPRPRQWDSNSRLCNWETVICPKRVGMKTEASSLSGLSGKEAYPDHARYMVTLIIWMRSESLYSARMRAHMNIEPPRQTDHDRTPELERPLSTHP